MNQSVDESEDRNRVSQKIRQQLELENSELREQV